MTNVNIFGEIEQTSDDVTVDNIRIDWLSFSLFLPDSVKTKDDLFSWVSDLLMAGMPNECYVKYFEKADWKEGKIRPMYSEGLRNEVHGINMLFGGQGHVLIEMQGKACALLAIDGYLFGIATHFVDTVTRFDVAIDFHGVSPLDMHQSMGNGRFKSSASKVSSSGETYYTGDRTSERYAKCYQYFEPHERANEPRVEFVNRKHYAKQAIRYWGAYGLSEVAQMCNNTFKFGLLPKLANIEEKLPSPVREKSVNKKVTWLLRQVKPAMLELLRKGEIDVKFVVDNFIPLEMQKSFLNELEDRENEIRSKRTLDINK